MRRMISEEKANLLNKQVIDSNGVIVDENDREFNGDINFTGTVTGITGGTQLYLHKFSIQDVDYQPIVGDVLYIINNVAEPTEFGYEDFLKCCKAMLLHNESDTFKPVYYDGMRFNDGNIPFNVDALISTEAL